MAARIPGHVGRLGAIASRDALREWQTSGPTALSGTSIALLSSISTADEIEIFFKNLTTDGTSAFAIRLGDAVGIKTTGYDSFAKLDAAGAAGAASTTHFLVGSSMTAASLHHGKIVLTHLGSHVWHLKGNLHSDTTTSDLLGQGFITLTSQITDVQGTMANGTDAFDGGNFYARWRSFLVQK